MEEIRERVGREKWGKDWERRWEGPGFDAHAEYACNSNSGARNACVKETACNTRALETSRNANSVQLALIRVGRMRLCECDSDTCDSAAFLFKLMYRQELVSKCNSM